MFWEAFLGIIFAIIIYNVIHRILVVNPTKKSQLKIEAHCQSVLLQLLKRLPTSNYDLTIVNSKVLSEVWGRGILVFEFKIGLDQLDAKDKLAFLNQYLKPLIAQRNADSKVNDAPLLITDLWQYDQFVHIEVAYLDNQSTKEYVNDINRLTE